jgi:hypothetical protein
MTGLGRAPPIKTQQVDAVRVIFRTTEAEIGRRSMKSGVGDHPKDE